MDKIAVKYNGRWFKCWYRKMTWVITSRIELCPLCGEMVLEKMKCIFSLIITLCSQIVSAMSVVLAW